MERLRKCVNERSYESMVARQRIGEHVKKMKEAIHEKDKEVKEIKNEKIHKYLKIINNKIATTK